MRNALIIIDMLNGFCNEKGTLFVGVDACAIIPFVTNKVEEAYRANKRVIFLADNHEPNDPEFKTWLTQTRSSIIELFGEKSLNDRNFMKIPFMEVGYRVGRPTGPSPRDRQIFKDGMKMAESVIKNAIEEVEITADVVETPYEPPPKPVKPSPQITVNVINMLSQVTNV